MNQALKHQLAKLMIETKLSWIKCLPLALLNIQTMPKSEHGISPYKVLYGMPYSQEMLGDKITCTEKDCNCYPFGSTE